MPTTTRPIASRRPARLLAATLTAGCLFASVAPAAAQTSSTPSDGDWSLMFTIFEPDALTHFGLARMVGDRVNLGFEAELEYIDAEQRFDQQGLVIRSDAANWDFLIGPTIRWYGTRTGPVSPYLRAKLAWGWGKADQSVNGTENREESRDHLQATLAVGAEWYPFPQIGIGGHTGLQMVQTDREIVDRVNRSETTNTTRNIRSFRSGLVVNFYFR